MKREDYQRLGDLRLKAKLSKAESDELQSLLDKVGKAVAVKDDFEYAEINDLGEDATQEQLDGLRVFENEKRKAESLPVFIHPEVQPFVSAVRVRRAVVRDLFTFAEKTAIHGSKDDGVKALLGDFDARDDIDIQSKRFADGLAYLVSKGLITEARAGAIKSNEKV